MRYFPVTETYQGCLNAIIQNVDGHLPLQPTLDITHGHTLEKSRILAHMRAVVEISHHQVIYVITNVHTVGKELLSASIQAVIACLHGQLI